MATLRKFRLLATQCAIAGSPTRSPSTSPAIHLRKRKTLRMLLSRGGSGRRRLTPRDELLDRRSGDVESAENSKNDGVRQKLKDLLVLSASPPSPPLLEENGGDETKRWSIGGGLIARRGGGLRGLRPLNGTLRQRLLRRHWRPVLVTIPE
ncbi:uncharacterized protein [Rutidosis leptorrhynchoides]|uniref:uncharacterized protein n=1 Tax=Rutidosis leptorrhynchoides TaxID=125765 RepID=UPI003A98CF31